MGQRGDDVEPDADAGCLLSERATRVANQLLRVQAQFDPVVEQGEEGSERKRHHEYSYKTELQHWTRYT